MISAVKRWSAELWPRRHLFVAFVKSCVVYLFLAGRASAKFSQVHSLNLSSHVSSTFPSPGLTAAAAAAANAAIAEAMKVKKIKLEAMSSYHSNANHHGGDGENGDLSSSVGETHTHTHTRAYVHTHREVASRYEFRLTKVTWTNVLMSP